LFPAYCTEVTAVMAPLTPARPVGDHDGAAAAFADHAPTPTPAAAVAAAAPIAIRRESPLFLETLRAMNVAPFNHPLSGRSPS
jgi:hypothetical protein